MGYSAIGFPCALFFDPFSVSNPHFDVRGGGLGRIFLSFSWGSGKREGRPLFRHKSRNWGFRTGSPRTRHWGCFGHLERCRKSKALFALSLWIATQPSRQDFHRLDRSQGPRGRRQPSPRDGAQLSGHPASSFYFPATLPYS